MQFSACRLLLVLTLISVQTDLHAGQEDRMSAALSRCGPPGSQAVYVLGNKRPRQQAAPAPGEPPRKRVGRPQVEPPQLPPEALAHIFHFLPSADLYPLLHAAKHFAHIIFKTVIPRRPHVLTLQEATRLAETAGHLGYQGPALAGIFRKTTLSLESRVTSQECRVLEKLLPALDGILGCEQLSQLDTCTRDKLLIEGCRTHRAIDFSDCYYLKKDHIAALEAVTSLDLTGTRADDALLGTILQRPHLSSLSLMFCRGMSQEGLQALAALNTLKSLNLSHWTGVDGEAFKPLMTMTNLTHLEAASAGLCDEAGVLLGRLTRLKSLNLSGNNALTASTFAQLTPLTALAELDLSACDGVTDQTLPPIAYVTQLKSLRLKACHGLVGEDTSPLKACTNLIHLEMVQNVVRDKALTFLTTLNLLRVLDLSHCKFINGAFLPRLAAASTLRIMRLNGCASLLAEHLTALGRLSRLSELGLHGCSQAVTDTVLHSIGTIRGLKSLDLRACPRVTDHGVASLQHVNLMQQLWLQGPNLGDAGMHHVLTQGDKLEHLTFRDGKVTARQVRRAFALRCLSSMDLRGTEVSYQDLLSLPTAKRQQDSHSLCTCVTMRRSQPSTQPSSHAQPPTTVALELSILLG